MKTANDNTQIFLDSAMRYADKIIENCSDKYGNKETSLFVDGVSLKTGEPYKWENYVISNLACQQNFLRTLDGLTVLTGDSKYEKCADEWISYAMDVLHNPNSEMLYWGGHTNYDLLEDKPLIGNHELKCDYPYYSFLYKVNSEATRLFVEGFWNKHVKNWSNLLFNRHGEYADWNKNNAWEHDYQGGSLPIIDNTMLSFINTGSDLIYSGASLAKLSGDNKSLKWAILLLQRYDEIRHKTTGLGGYQFNHREPCRVRMSFKKPLSDRSDVNETTVLTNGVIGTRYGRVALVLLNLFDELGSADGRAFLNFVIKDLKAIAEYAYDPSENSFTPLLIDGMKLQPSDCIEGAGYTSPRGLEKIYANGLMFLVYVKAYRITRDNFFWQMARNLARGIGLDAIYQATDTQSANLRGVLTDKVSLSQAKSLSAIQNQVCIVLGLLELYKVTKQVDYLTLAMNIGNQSMQEHLSDGFFVVNKEDGYVSLDNSLPLALLHILAIAGDKCVNIPVFYPNSTSFDPKVIIAYNRKQ